MTLSDDPRVRAGLQRQLELRRQLLDDGVQPLGWKAGLGSPPTAEPGSGPLVGFMTERSPLASGAELAVGDWAAPAVEAEIAVRLRVDVDADASRDQVAEAIDAIAPAIEVVDFDGPRDDIEAMLAGNIFHRHVVLGAWDEGRAGANLDDVLLDVDGWSSYASQLDPVQRTGHPVDVVRHLAVLLSAFDERLRAGDVIITGSAVAAIPTSSGEHIVVRHSGLGEVELRLT